MDKRLQNLDEESLPKKDFNKILFKEIEKISVEKSYSKGEIIFYEEDEGYHFYYILKGKIRIFKSYPDGREKTLEILSPHTFFGELSILTGKPRSASAEAFLPTKLLVTSKKDFIGLIESFFDIAKGMIGVLANRLYEADIQIGNLSFYTNYGKVARTVLWLAERFGISSGDQGIMIEERFTHNDIAHLAGISRESVTRIFTEFRKEGSIEIERKGRIRILNKEKLIKWM